MYFNTQNKEITMKFSLFSQSILISSFLMKLAACEGLKDHCDESDIKVKPEKLYRDILQQTIELLWTQKVHVIQMKIRESSIRRKTKFCVPEMQDIIRDTYELIENELGVLANKYWTPKPNEKRTIPMTVETVEHFMNNWKKFDELVNTDLQNRHNIEEECEEIKEEMHKAVTHLPSCYEDIKQQMTVLEKIEKSTKKAKWSEKSDKRNQNY